MEEKKKEKEKRGNRHERKTERYSVNSDMCMLQ